MPVSFSSPPRNLFLLGSSGADVVRNFFHEIDKSSGTDDVYIPDEIRYDYNNDRYNLAGTAQDSNSKEFGWLERRNYDPDLTNIPSVPTSTEDWNVRIESTLSNIDTTLRAMESYGNDLVVVGKTGQVPWIAKYTNNGSIDWQSTTNSANVEYTGVCSDGTNYYACGNTPDTGSNVTNNQAIAFVEKFDSNGNPSWGKSATMLGRDVVLEKISANSRGEVIAVGYLEDDTADKGYIVKIDTFTGKILWDRTLERNISGSGGSQSNDGISAANVRCTATYIDGNDFIYVVGSINGVNPVNNGVGEFVVKYSPEGNILWQRENNTDHYTNLDGAPNMIPFDVKSDTDTQQTVVLSVQDQGSFALNNSDIFISKYSKDGSLVFRRKISKGNNNLGAASLDADPSFYYVLFRDQQVVPLSGTPDRYFFGKVSTSGNGLGNFQYDDGGSTPVDYTIVTNAESKIGRLSDGSVRNDSSDFITYPFSANKLVFDDFATHVSNKKRQMDSADSFEYSGSPAIRPADFQELNLLGNVYSGSGDWLDQSGKGNNGEIDGATYNSGGYWNFGTGDEIDFGTQASIITSGSCTVEAWAWRDAKTAENGLFNIEDDNQGVILLSAGGNYSGGVDYRFLVRKGVCCAVQANVQGSLGHGLNEWHHYVGTYDDNTGTIVMYVDGVQVATDTNASIIGVNFSGTLDRGIMIGPSAARGRFHNGRVGEVRVYQRDLTAAQVFQNYNATKSRYIDEAPDIAPKLIGSNIVYDQCDINYDFGNKATYDPAENLLEYSEDFSKWTIQPNTTVQESDIMPPLFGDRTVRLITANQTESAVYQAFTGAATRQHVYSVFIKPGTVNKFRLRDLDGGSNPGHNVTVTLSNNGFYLFSAENNVNIGDYGAIPLPNGWYRVFFRFTPAGYTNLSFNIRPTDGQTGTFYLWGAQVEVTDDDVPGRYIRTEQNAIKASTTFKNISSGTYEPIGTIDDAVFYTGAKFNRDEGCFELDGSDLLDLNSTLSTVADETLPASWEAWVYFNAGIGNNQTIIGNSFSSGGVLLRTTGSSHPPADRIRFVYFINGSNGTGVDSASALTTGWHHIVGTYNGNGLTTSNFGLHVDGYPISTTDPTFGSPSGSSIPQTQDFGIGGLPNEAGNYFWNGKIAEVRVYKKSLTATEVLQNFEATRGKYGL